MDTTIFDWKFNKQVRELEGEIQSYEIHAKREIENNKIAKPDKVRTNSQRYLQGLLNKYKELTGKDYNKKD